MHSLRTTLGRRLVAMWVVSAVAFGCLASARAGAEELPRYKLKVGQELVYRTTDPPKETDDGKGNKSSNHTVFEWIVDVVDGNAESGWWIVFRQKISATYSYNGKENKQEYETDGQLRLSADGRLSKDTTIQPMGNPTTLIPALPPDAASLKSGWEVPLALDETLRKFHVEADAVASSDRWHVVEEPTTALDVIYEMTTRRDYTFDRQAGLVRKVVSTAQYGWPASQAEKPQVQTIELAEVRELDTGDLQALLTQAQQYFAAVEEYEKLTERARREFSHTATQYIEAESKLKAVESSLTVPWLRTMLEGRLKQHKRDMQFAVEDAVRFVKLLDQPSEEWKTTDLDDQPHALVDYRGKVVVLDFWYRGCGWCIRAMPQMKQLTDDFKDQSVAILGINSDQNLDDARYVIDKLGLNYATLKNGQGQTGISTMYKIHGWPTLVVIDRQGVVRHIHFGYSPTLRSELGDKIRQLLAEPAG